MPTSIAEIKNDLHRMIVETDDAEILEQVAFLFAALRQEEIFLGKLSEREKSSIQQGLNDLKMGKIKSNEELRTKVRALLQ